MVNSKIRGSFWLQDIKRIEYVFGILRTTAVFLMLLYVFYESFLPGIILFPVWILYMKEWLEDRTKKKEMEFSIQFRDSIQAVSAALKAGYSVENAIRETRKDLKPLYGKDERIMKEYDLMVRKLDMNRTAGQVLSEFAERVDQEDVTDFVNVFSAAKQSGGDSIALIRNAVKIIGEKIDTEKEIQTMLAAKKLEFEIMCAVPFFIILYMKLTFGDFLSMLYGNLFGGAVMSICLAVYLAAYAYGRSLMRIEV